MAGTVEGTVLVRRAYPAAELLQAHPPVLRNANKRLLFDMACPPGALHRGSVMFTRWAAMQLPPKLPAVPPDLVAPVPGFYDYRPMLPGSVEWHVNFADPHLFVAYGGPLFAQDEMQVAEHPALGALREALAAEGTASTTISADGPTPILVSGVERRVCVRTNPDAAAGRPHGLYGNAFAAASPDAIRRAATVLDPPTVSNILAMSAPPGGYGRYRRDEIGGILGTAYTGFRAAVLESARLRDGAPVVVHTGYWGCGAFAGNRVLMALLQVAAADLAGLGRLVLHTGAGGGERPLVDALGLLGELLDAGPCTTDALVSALEEHGFQWGVSDGN